MGRKGESSESELDFSSRFKLRGKKKINVVKARQTLLQLSTIKLLAVELKARFSFSIQEGRSPAFTIDISYNTFLVRNSLLQLLQLFFSFLELLLQLSVTFLRDFTETGIKIWKEIDSNWESKKTRPVSTRTCTRLSFFTLLALCLWFDP